MGVRYKGMDMRDLSSRMRLRSNVAIDELEQIVSMTVEEAERDQKALLDRAVTRYGALRMSRGDGRSAGRNDEGDLIDAISSDVKPEKTKVTGKWGWLSLGPENPRGKVLAQDFGGSPSRIPAAHSLLDSYVQARAKFISRISALGGKRGR